MKVFTQFSSEPILLPQSTVLPAPTDRDEETLLALTEELSVNEGPTDTNNCELDFENNTIEEVLKMEAFETDMFILGKYSAVDL